MEICACAGKPAPFLSAAPTLALALLAAQPIQALDNGVARTPPMGWNPWNCFQVVDENALREEADAMAASGLKDAGYLYCNIDGGWWTYFDYSTARNSDGTMRPRPELFPSGMKAIGDYVHSKGLKFGHYSMPAQLKELPGTGNIEKDAQTYADWGVDYLKFDGWSETPDGSFTGMRDALKATGRPIVLSINGNQGAALANQWRTSGDIDGTWASMYESLTSISGGGGKPGAWPDPDMLLVGNNYLTFEEEKTHFSGWCIGSAPLIAGNDLRAMTLRTKYILLNTEAIAVNQDTSVNDSKRVKQGGGTELWAKTLKGGAKAVLLVNTGAAAANGSVAWSDIGLSGAAQVRDLWEHADKGSATNSYAVSLPSHGCAFLKITPGSAAPAAPAATWAPKPPAPYAFTALDRAGWSISASGGSNAGEASKLLDGNLKEQWTPNGGEGSYFTIDMKAAKGFNCVALDATGDGSAIPPYETYGIKSHWAEVYVSNDNATWGKAVFTGPWGPHNTSLFTFPAQNARYVKVVGRFQPKYSNPADEGNDREHFGFGALMDEVYVGNTSATTALARRAADKSPAALRRLWTWAGAPQVAPGIRYYRGDGRKAGR